MSDDYCKMFLETSGTHEEVLSRIAEHTNGRRQRRTIETPTMIIDCFLNKELRGKEAPEELAQSKAEFLFWPYYLEIESQSGVDRDAFIRGVQNLIDALKSEGIRVVAACDFEDALVT